MRRGADRGGGALAREFAERCACHQAGAAGVVVVEEAAHQLAGGVEAEDGRSSIW